MIVYDSNNLDIVDGAEVVPAVLDHEFDHNVAAWLVDLYALVLLLASASCQFARLSNLLEAVAIGGLTTFDGHSTDARRHKSHLVDNLGLRELNCQLLWVHARGQPKRVVISIASSKAI